MFTDSVSGGSSHHEGHKALPELLCWKCSCADELPATRQHQQLAVGVHPQAWVNLQVTATQPTSDCNTYWELPYPVTPEFLPYNT